MSLYVFNQYYFDLLKKVKDYSRENKDKPQANTIRSSIKTNYSSYDITSSEYRDFFIKNTEFVRDTWEKMAINDIKDAKSWLVREDIGGCHIYEGISLLDVESSIRSKKTFFYYFTLLCIFVKDMTEEQVGYVVGLLKNIKNIDEFVKSLESIEDELLKRHLTFLLYLQRQSVSAATSSNNTDENHTNVREGIDETMQQLETTSLGKLAKEIMSDIDVNEVHNSISKGGNILESLTNPEGGLSKLLGTVSQKMISKMASGEIKQETLLQDALKFSGQLQNMIPKDASGMGGFGDIANMMSKVGDLANMMNNNSNNSDSSDDDDSSGGFNLAKMASMLGNLNNDIKKSKKRPVINQPELTRVTKAKQLRKKLERKKREKEEAEKTQS
jgi:hypothetical protein